MATILEQMTAQHGCFGCGVVAGQIHYHDCDQQLCAECGWKRNGNCHCKNKRSIEPLIFSGWCPQEEAAMKYGWYSEYDEINCKWLDTTRDNPNAQPNISRAAHWCRWDKKTKSLIYVESKKVGV